jgi:O-antigen ligase
VTTPTAAHPYDFDPALVADRTYASRRRYRVIDITAVINFMVILLFLLPTRLALPNLSGVGRPALMVGLLLTVLWLLSKVHRGLGTRGPQPIRWAAIAFLVSFLMSYSAGYLRGLPSIEANGADLTLIATIIFLGIIISIADFVPNRARLDAVIRTIVWGGAVMAIIGHIEFTLGIVIAPKIALPGLVFHGDLVGLEARGVGFYRVASTATHYIEFSSVMALCLPFAIHLVLFDPDQRTRRRALVAAALIGAAVPVALSRTGILALLLGLLAVMPTWPWRARLNICAAAVCVMAAMVVVRPGLLGTIKSLFLSIDSDPSIQGRTDDYSVVGAYIAERPILGRGFGTFIPDLYVILDNQYLQTIIGGGFVGLAALVGLHLATITVSVIALRRSTSAADRHLCACLISVQLIGLLAHATFDSFAFSTFATLLGIGAGLSGAIWRLTHPSRQIRSTGRPVLGP